LTCIERVGGSMKINVLVIALLCLTAVGLSEDESLPGQTIIVQKISGSVSIRHGVAEQWIVARTGELLRPHDTMKTGKDASAVVMVRSGNDATSVKRKTLSLPGDVMIDMSDIRDLSQEELMLKLTMERVRSSSYQWRNDELNIPSTTVIHGADGSLSQALNENDAESGVLELNGSKVLYENGFYSTCALKTMEVLRRYPALGSVFENRLLVAQALEKANLSGEALNEYVALSGVQTLDARQQETVRARISSLKKQPHQ